MAVLVTAIGIAYPSLAADPPKITVAPVWRPGTQLTTVDTGIAGQTDQPNDDIRYVDAEIRVTTSVTFWAVQLTCTVAPTILGSYTVGGDPGGWMDDQPVVTWGPDWGNPGFDFATIEDPLTATGAKTITATRLGTISSLGQNGFTMSTLLATIRYRVKGIAGTSPFTCTGSFLNRDGNSVLAPTFTAPAPLLIGAGYTITGNVSYQSRAVKTGIGILCWHTDTSTSYPAVTDAAGKFTINTRLQGGYYCDFFGNISTPAAGYQPDIYLRSEVWFGLNDASYKFLPIVLKGGNLDQVPVSGSQVIDSADLLRITGNWNLTSPLGDINGDTKTDKADLAILGSNYNYWENVSADHVIYSVARSWGTTGPENRIWRGEQDSGNVTQLIPGTSRDFWPAFSQDGSKIAFTRLVGTKYSLFVMNADGTGTATQITPSTAWYDAFAPSWSPDGARIAFICGASGSWQFNYANLCIIDATGRNFQQIDYSVKIYPPAWFSNQEIIYAGVSSHWACPASLCKSWVENSWNTQPLDSNIPMEADMPSFQSGMLVYRYTSGSDKRLRIAGFDYSGSSPDIPAFPTEETTPGVFHLDARYDSDPTVTESLVTLSTMVDYYALSRDNRNIMFTEIDSGGNGGFYYTNAFFFWGSTNLQFYEPWGHWVHNGFSNPWWNTSDVNYPNNPTELHALRNTIAWVP